MIAITSKRRAAETERKGRRGEPPIPAPRRHNRKEILGLAESMAAELISRAESAASHGEAQAFLRSAQLMHELVGIADGRRTSAYWTRRPRTGQNGPALPTALARLRRFGTRLPGSGAEDATLVA
ncbi:MAG: hypothetical protein CSA65_00505 [Proteobacteria bacterium]|nr:MAG: hypothetical protein CSB49_00065 [Pseudomonadota bacterium]PIE19957.1 MAG: hypothetical protein CSA65_00505 [Pseudomonadota bacterium]